MSGWWRRCRDDERGTSLAEVVVASVVVTIAIAIALPLLVTGQRTFAGQAARTDANDEAALVLARVEADVRSGNVVAPPSGVGGLPGATVTLYSQVGGSPFRCVQYEVRERELRRRERAPGAGVAWPSQWSTVAAGVENAVLASPVAPFTRSADGRTLGFQLVLRRAPEAGATVTVRSSITGRNARNYETPFSGAQCT